MEMSPERQEYHRIIPKFISSISFCGKRQVIYDIGRSDIHDYSATFKDFDYKTVDRDPFKRPDISLDIEGLNEISVDDYLDRADGLLCNGVIEQCNDPFAMLRACRAMLKDGGIALFGMVLLGYPALSLDNFRFTKSGAVNALKKCGFSILYVDFVERDGVPTYVYAICKKKVEKT